MLRPDLLDGRRIAVTGGAAGCVAACTALGADVVDLGWSADDEQAMHTAAAAAGRVDVLIADGAQPGAPVSEAVNGVWNALRAVAVAGWIPEPGGRAVLLAPRPGSGPDAPAVAAALENTARTLSTEWARYAITVAAVLPGDATTQDEVADLVAFLCSRAGAYYSGCAFTLGAV